MLKNYPNRNLFKAAAFRRAAFSSLLMLLLSNVADAQTQLHLTGAPGSLAVLTSGKKTLQFDVSPPVNVAGAKLTVSVLAYDSNGKVLASPLASYAKTIGDAQKSNVINVSIAIPRSGLYRVDASLKSPDGEMLAQSSSTLSAVARRDEVGPSDFGVVTHFGQGGTAPSVLLPLVKQAGFAWIRDELYWQEIEKKPGVFSFPASYDAYLAACARLGISPLVVLDYGNQVAYPSLFANSTFPQSPEARAKFVSYVDAVVKRYGNTVKNWELWNEPDFNTIGYGNYLALLKVTYSAIKQRSPDSTVISCGGGGAGGGPGGDCLVALIKEGGLNDQDAFSIHPYMPPNAPEIGYKGKGGPIDVMSIPTTWPYLKQLTAQHVRENGRPVQVWVTELGWPVNPKEPGQDEATQAANLVRTYLLSRRYGAVRVLFWYDFVDDGTDPNNFEQNFGLLHHDLTPKPAFVAASVLSSTVGKRAWGKALVDTQDVKAYQYGTDDPVIAGWTTDGQERTASVSLPAGRYIQRDWQGIDTPVTITAQSYEWRVGPLPRYLIPDQAPH
jgi:hypothetical protein